MAFLSRSFLCCILLSSLTTALPQRQLQPDSSILLSSPSTTRIAPISPTAALPLPLGPVVFNASDADINADQGDDIDFPDPSEPRLPTDFGDDVPKALGCAAADSYTISSTKTFSREPLLLNTTCSASSCIQAAAPVNVTYTIIKGTDINATAIILATNYTTPIAHQHTDTVLWPLSGSASTSNMTCPPSASCGVLEWVKYLNVTGVHTSGCNNSQEGYEVHFPVLKTYSPLAPVEVDYSVCVKGGGDGAEGPHGLPSCDEGQAFLS